MNEFRNLPEESEASKRAKQMGLVYKGFGRWADPKTGKVTHKTDNGQLVPIGQEKQHPGMTDPTKVAPGGKKRPNPGRPHPDLGPPPARDIPQRGDDESEDDYYDRMAARASSQDRGEMGLDTDPSQDITTPKPKKIGHPKTDPKSLDDKELAQHVKKLDHHLDTMDRDFGHKRGAQDAIKQMSSALSAAEKELQGRQGDGQHPMDKDYDPAEDPVRAGYDTARDRLSNPDADKGVDAITQDIHNVPDGIDKKEFYKGYMKAVKDYKSKGKSEPTAPEPEDEPLGDLAKRYEKLKSQQQQMIQKAKKALDQNDKEALASLEKVGKQIKNDLKSVKDKIKAKKKGSDIEYPDKKPGIGKDQYGTGPV